MYFDPDINKNVCKDTSGGNFGYDIHKFTITNFQNPLCSTDDINISNNFIDLFGDKKQNNKYNKIYNYLRSILLT